MQSIWKGAVSFGMVTIPVKVYAATEERDISFRQVHAVDGGRIRYKRVCDIDGEEVPYSDIAKGYQLADGQILVLEPEDLAELPLPTRKVIDVLEFVPFDQIDPTSLARAYYLAVDGGVADKPYALLRDALRDSGRVAIVKVALRNRESLALLRAVDETLVLQTMLWPDEVRAPSVVTAPTDVELRDQEVAMARSYIETLSDDFDPDRYHDEYRAALEAVIEAKIEGHEVAEAPSTPTTGQVVDLMAALRASVDEARRRRGEQPSTGDDSGAAVGADADTENADEVAEARPAGKTTGKTTAKKSAGKTSASKTSAGKTSAPKKAATKTSAGKTTGKKAASKTSASKKTAASTRKSAGTRARKTA
jgi:DNA end-binding protein Ku